MKVELERKTSAAGERSITLVASDSTSNASTVEKWIAMLKLAEKWLRTGK